jgi:hypothetical protein
MPFAEVQLTPGVDVENSPAGNPSGVQESNFIRWRAKLPEKRGGCTLYLNERVNGATVSLRPWGSFQGNNYLGIATPNQVYSYNATTDLLRDISPQYFVSSLASPLFSTAVGDQIVTITDSTEPGVGRFDAVQFNTPISIGGLILNGTYPIISALGTNQYTIDAGYAANAANTNVAGVLPEFSTTAGLSRVIVTFPIQYQFGSLGVGDQFGLSVPTVVGGLTLFGAYVVSQILSSTQFTFQAEYAASSSESLIPMNDGFAYLTYWITEPPGPPPPSLFSTFSAPESIEPAIIEPVSEEPALLTVGTSPVVYTANNWWLDSIGSTFIAAAENGPIFSYSPVGGYQNLSILPNAPPISAGAFVAMPSGQIMAWGTSDTINPIQSSLYIRWSDSTDINNWTIGGQSTAGFYNVPTGSKIVRGIQAPNQQFWFTDVDVYSAQYTGYPDFFGFLKIGAGCGLLAPRGVGIVNNSVFWMSQEQFFMCQAGSAPQPLPCPVWDFIFQNSTQENLAKTICGGNSLFNEVIWFFPSNSSSDGYPDSYVCYNTLYNEWDYGSLRRTAWTDQSVLGFPIAADSEGWIYQHETSYNLAEGQTTQPINASLTTGYSRLAQGEDLIFVDWMIPDMKWAEWDGSNNTVINFTFNVTDYPGQQPRVYGPYTASKQTPYISPRFRGRFMSMKIESNDLDSFWRLGSIRYRYAPSGRR